MALGLFAPQAGATDVIYDMSALSTGSGGTPAYLGNISNGYASNPLQDNWVGLDPAYQPATASTVWNTNLGIYSGQKVMHGGYNGLNPNPSPNYNHPNPGNNAGSGGNYNGKNFGVAYNQTGVVTTMLITFNLTNNVTPLGTGGGFNFFQHHNGLDYFFSNPASDNGVGMNLQIGGGGTSINIGYFGVGQTFINSTGWSVPSWYFGSSAALTDWFSAKMVVDPTANSGDGGATCYWKDETTNSAWVQFGASNIAVGRIANEVSTNAWTALTGVNLSVTNGVEVRAFGIKSATGTTISPASATVDYPANTTTTIAVDTAGTWTASSDSAWAVVSPSSGNYFNKTVTVTCAANTTSSVRTATITVNGQTSTVIQAVNPAYSTGTNITYDMSALSTGAGGSPAYLGSISNPWAGYGNNPLQDHWIGGDIGSTPDTKTTVWNSNLGIFTGQKVMHNDYNGLNANPYGTSNSINGSGAGYNGKDFVSHYNADGVTSVLQVTFNASNCVAPVPTAGGGFSFRQHTDGQDPFWSVPANHLGVGMGLTIGGNSSISSFAFTYFGVGSTSLDNTGFVWFQPSTYISGASLTDWYTMKMVVNPMGNGGQGSATCYWRDVTKNSGWIQVGAANQNIHRENEVSTNTWSTLHGVNLSLGNTTGIEVRDFSITAGATSTSTPTTASAAAAANSTATISVTSNEVWNAHSDSSWAVVSTAAGANSGTVTVTCAANTGAARVAWITINGNYVELTQAASATFSTWIAGYPGLSDSTPAGNPSHDGISNLVKYALGLDPTVSGHPVGSLSGNTLAFNKGTMAQDDSNIAYSIEESTDLVTWAAPTLGSYVNYVDSVVYTFPSSGPTKVFARLKVVQTP